MIYLYAIKHGPRRRLPTLRGLDEAPLRYVHNKGMAAVVSATTTTEVAPTPERLWRHASVVEALMAQQTVLPAQFATSFRDERAVSHLLDLYQDQFREDLERLHGCVEISLRVVHLKEPATFGKPTREARYQQGSKTRVLYKTDYDLAEQAIALQRAAQQRRDEALGEMINRALQARCLDHVVRVEENDRLLIRASYLVARDGIDAFQGALERLTKAYPSLLFICSGPWPPYHFVRILCEVQDAERKGRESGENPSWKFTGE